MASPRLVAKNPVDPKTREFRLSKAEITVGSEKGNLLLLRADSVSRRHAVVRPRGGFYEVYDLKSTNGTFVNDRRVAGAVVLNDRDYVRFGGVEFVYLDPEAERRRDGNRSSSTGWLVVLLLIMVAAGFGITDYLFNHFTGK